MLFAGGYYLGREMAQAEYRVIEQYYGRRSKMLWYGGFEPRGWDLKSVLDFGLPIIVTAIALIIIKLEKI